MADAVHETIWEQKRSWKFVREKAPSDWPDGVKPISMQGISLLGIDADNNLYWDGRRLQHITRLGRTRPNSRLSLQHPPDDGNP
ncbi:hypothetical protein FHX03_004750 [Rhizobium sp. BK456]|nr:hypothetical protein [Rhizobium sp. BK456]